MAKFLDVKLKGEKGLSDDDVESVLDKVMVLFRCGALDSSVPLTCHLLPAAHQQHISSCVYGR